MSSSLPADPFDDSDDFDDADPFDENHTPRTLDRDESEWSEPTLQCSSFSGGRTLNPSLDFLKSIVSEQQHPYWRYEGAWVALMIVQFKDTGKVIRVFREAPSLSFVFKEEHGFYFDYRERVGGDQFSPYDRNQGRRKIDQPIDIDLWRVPVGCYVNHQVAWKIVEEYYVSKQRASLVEWVNHQKLKIHHTY